MYSIAIPFGTKMAWKRRTGLAAGRASADTPGAIASRNGSATVAPTPRRTVRRDKGFAVMMLMPLMSVLMSARSRPRRLNRHSAARLIRNAGLSTTPRMIDDQRYPSAAALRTMPRTVGWS